MPILMEKFQPVWERFLTSQYDRPDEEAIIKEASPKELVTMICALDARMVVQGPRQIVTSKVVNRNPSTLKNIEGYKYLLNAIRTGDDLTPHLSHRLPSVASGAERASEKFLVDVLLESWGIYHLHVPKRVPPRKKDLRNDCLLFCCFGKGMAVVLDIRERHDFKPDGLINVLIDEFGGSNLVHEVKGAVGLSGEATANDRLRLLMNGVNSGYERRGKVYMGVRGLASDVRGLHNTMRAHRIEHYLEELEASEKRHHVSSCPDFSDLVTDYSDNHFGLVNIDTRVRYKLPFEFSYNLPIKASSWG